MSMGREYISRRRRPHDETAALRDKNRTGPQANAADLFSSDL